jgi:hypothetical protein
MPHAGHHYGKGRRIRGALSVLTRRGVVSVEATARSKKLRAATMSRVSET